MQTFKSISQDLYPADNQAFEEIALKLFQFQAANNPVYSQYLTYIGVAPGNVTTFDQIPFLPIGLFKTQTVVTGQWTPELVFLSSATTGQVQSRHAIPSLEFYVGHAQRIFEESFGSLKQFHVLCLLPSYLERTGSSLVVMADHFIKQSQSPISGFFLNDLDRLISQLEASRDGRKVLLLGVSFALLDLAEKYDVDLSHCMVMETGGMKGRRQEITREELHQVLCKNLNVQVVHSEYGMTEILSQAYSSSNGLFKCPKSLRIVLKEVNDPFSKEECATGVINVIDLANTHSCAFIETRDLGRADQQGHFEVLGRIDNSEIRGCNLLVE